MWRFESSINIIARIVEDEVHRTVPECATGRIEVIFRDHVGWLFGRLSVLRVKLQDVVPQLVLRCLDLFEDVLVTEDVNVIRQWLLINVGIRTYTSIPSIGPGLTSTRIAD